MIPFLMNPPGKRRPKAGGRRRRRGAKARTKKRRKLTMARRKSRGGRKRRRNAPGRRRRRAVAISRRRRNSPRRSYRRARGRRRNPPGRRLFGGGGGRGIVGQLTSGFVDAAWVLGGEAGTNIIAGFIPLDKTGPMGLVTKLAAAVGVAWLAKRVSPNAAKMALAGGLASLIRGPIKGANLPLISANLGDLYDEGYYAVGAGAYPALPGVASYPQEMGDAADDEYSYVQQ
jgi:hypothetical protein